jgi:predicted phosphodiesterase
MRKEEFKTQLAREYVEKYIHLPSLTIARKLYDDNKLVYKDVEDCRNAIRRIRGALGDIHRNYKSSDKSLYGTTPKPIPSLPESSAVERKPLILPLANNNILVMSDFHIPYHTNEAIESAINYGLENKVNTLILNGDILDFYMLSRFEKDPRKRSVKFEFDTCRQLLEYIRHKFPKADIFWTLGNHDMRYEKWLMLKAPEIFDDPYYSLEERLQLNDLRIKTVDNLTMIMAGKLYIAHGDKWQNGLFSPVNPARGLYMKLKKSALMSHVHNTSQHTEKDVAGGMTSCWSIGCMCELRPDYNPYCNKYNHGFAHVMVNKDGTFNVKNFMIIDGQIH